MEQSRETVANTGMLSRDADGLSKRYARGGILCLGIVSALVAIGGCAARHALSPTETPSVSDGSPTSNSLSLASRLSVRPHTMASGTRTVRAGLQPLDSLHWGDSLHGGDSLKGTFVYVPPQCVGTQRAPLVVFLHGAGMTGLSMINWHWQSSDSMVRQLADLHGFIILATTAKGGSWHLSTATAPSPDVRRIDNAMRYVLRHYAIDPTRIAMAGASNGGGMALILGLANGDVFSRILGFSPAVYDNVFGHIAGDTTSRRNTSSYTIASLASLPNHGKPPLFIQHGKIPLPDDLFHPEFDAHPVVEWLRHAGYTVTYAVDSGYHTMTQERATAGFSWLAASWKGGAEH